MIPLTTKHCRTNEHRDDESGNKIIDCLTGMVDEGTAETAFHVYLICVVVTLGACLINCFSRSAGVFDGVE